MTALTPPERVIHLRARGYLRQAISDATGLSLSHVNKVIRENVEAIRQLQRDVDPSSVQVLRECLESPDEKTRMRAAELLLRYAGTEGDEPSTNAVPPGSVIVSPHAQDLVQEEDDS